MSTPPSKPLDVTMMEDFKSQLQNSNVARGEDEMTILLENTIATFFTIYFLPAKSRLTIEKINILVIFLLFEWQLSKMCLI